ncbi:hypothetical protein [Protofrankia symbiont of Coriaria ruscifolia]|uniref:hypothetical protein n=1 Tax=Protofrankia symbiont of Coriaria ruscifolia TaxID=1306542 RepID=UPI0010416623|nr:hypothetical protein [Protofrankia symbiont of Coriaria ruscifolia]
MRSAHLAVPGAPVRLLTMIVGIVAGWTFLFGFVRHEAPVRREALGIEGGARPPRRAVAAVWWELSAV